jgi:hypothetical protein
MKASTLIEALALEFGENPQDGDVVQALLGFIKDTVQDINIQGEWQHTRLTYPFSTDQGTAVINLPENVGTIIGIQRTVTGRPLQYVNIETLTDGSLILTDEGEPAFWNYEVIEDGVAKLRFYPTPDAEYSYKLWYEDATSDILTEDSNISVPNDFIPVLKHGVRVMYYAQSGEATQVEIYDRRFHRGIQFLRSRHEHIRRDEQGTQHNDIEEQAQWPTPQLPTYYPRIG